MTSAGLSLDTDDGRGLPLFPELAAPSPFRRPVAAKSLFEDPLLEALARTRPVRRLTRIGFLGAIDRTKSRNWHNRYDHSVAVARLALLYATNRNLSQRDTRVLAVAGLLHDVGHGPLSHTLEPIFKRRFNISHHKSGYRIIRGESGLGREIPDLLSLYHLDLDEISAMIDGTHGGPHAFLFSSPINLDTIDGVTRFRSFFFGKRPDVGSAAVIVRAISETDTLPTRTLDTFWRLKHEMYNSILHGPPGLLYDGLAQAAATRDIHRFAPRDFLKDEPQFRRREPRLFKLLDRARKSPRRLRKGLPDAILNHEVDAPTRTFFRNTSVELKAPADLVRRYKQTRTFRKVRISELLPTEDPTNCPYRIMQTVFSMPAGTAPKKASEPCAKPLEPCSTVRPTF